MTATKIVPQGIFKLDTLQETNIAYQEEKENHFQKCLGKGFFSSQEGSETPFEVYYITCRFPFRNMLIPTDFIEANPQIIPNWCTFQ